MTGRARRAVPGAPLAREHAPDRDPSRGEGGADAARLGAALVGEVTLGGAIVQTEARRVTERAVGRRVLHDDDLTAGAQERPRRLVSRVGVREGQRAEDQDRRCRCLETARLAFGGAEPWPALNSFFHDRSLEAERTREVRALVSERPATANLVLVTHQLNIDALAGVHPREGELVVLTPLGQGQVRVAGTMRP